MTPTAARRPLAVLGGSLLLTLLVAFGFLGSVKPEYQAVLHVMMAVCAGLALLLPSERFESAGVTVRWAVAGLVLGAVLTLGLLPVPRGLAAVLAPGNLDAWPEASWLTLAVDPWRVPGRLATLALVFGFGALVATWGASRHRRYEAELGLTLLIAILATSALMHAVLGGRAMLGLIAPDFVPETFFAPFVNGHHASSVMVFGGSVALGVALNPEEGGPARLLAGWAVLAAGAILLWDRSTGAILAAGLVACLWLLHRWRRSRLLLIVTPIVVVVAQAWAATAARVEVSVLGRLAIWRDTLTMIPQFWLAGTGGGTFGDALRAYRTDNAFITIRHAHNEPLEWVAETGLCGLVAAGVVAVLLWPTAMKEPRRADGLRFGLIGIAAHSLVEFPFQLPAVAMLGAAGVACLGAVFGGYKLAKPQAVRLCLIGVGLAQVPGAVWQLREAHIEHAIVDVGAFKADPERAGAGARALAAARAVVPERALFAAWSAESANDVDAAVTAALSVRTRFPNAPRALLEAGSVLARAGRYDDATAVLERAAERDRSDHRAWVILARVARAQGDRRLSADRWVEAFHRAANGVAEAYATFPVGLYWLGALENEEPRYSQELARELVRVGDLEGGLLACEQAARLDPANFGDDMLRARILLRLGRGADALPWLEEMLARRPDDPAVLEDYGDILDALGRHQEASVAYLEGAQERRSLSLKALRSTEAAAGSVKALALARRFELVGSVGPELGLEIARIHLRAKDPAACVMAIQRWNLATSPIGPQAILLLDQCEKAKP